jgi:hypothetical protein
VLSGGAGRRAELAAVGLSEGCRMEVLWDVDTTKDDPKPKEGPAAGGDEFTSEWWGCTVSPQGTPLYDAAGARVWELAYDPKPHLDAPEGALHMVTLRNNHELFDMVQGSGFAWRIEGAECLAPQEVVTFTEVMQVGSSTCTTGRRPAVHTRVGTDAGAGGDTAPTAARRGRGR